MASNSVNSATSNNNNSPPGQNSNNIANNNVGVPPPPPPAKSPPEHHLSRQSSGRASQRSSGSGRSRSDNNSNAAVFYQQHERAGSSSEQEQQLEEYQQQYQQQMSNVHALKAQLKLVTQERDVLKTDLKRLALEREGFYATGNCNAGVVAQHQALPHHGPLPPTTMDLQHHQHHRTASDSAPSSKPGLSSTLSRSHSIAAAGDKSLLLSISSPAASKAPPEMVLRGSEVNADPPSMGHDVQVLRNKLDQALKDADYYHRETESLRSRCSEVLLEKSRLEKEVTSIRLYMEEERKEMAELRRQQEDILNSDGGPGESLSIMYGTMLRNYERCKEDYSHLRRRYDDLVSSHGAAVGKLEHSADESLRFKKMYQDVLTEMNQLKQQCTQAIRQWDQALRERNDYKEALGKTQRKLDEALKQLQQAMDVRVKASKDLKRLTEERNAAVQEYTLIMSERDSVHKEIEKLQEELNDNKTKYKVMEQKAKGADEERRKLECQVEMLKREIEQSLHDRDRAVKEAHELRERYGASSKGDSFHSPSSRHHKSSSEKKASSMAGAGLSLSGKAGKRGSGGEQAGELIASSSGSQVNIELSSSSSGGLSHTMSSSNPRADNLEAANSEIDRLRKDNEKLSGELQDANVEAEVAKGRRDWAFSERDKVVLERESIRTLCDKLRRERDRAVSELAEALRESDDVKKQRNESTKENKELKERLDCLEKEVRLSNLQRASASHSHSHDSAIDSDLQESWEMENVNIDLSSSSNATSASSLDLGVDLAGGRDDLAYPASKPVYVAAIGKSSVLAGKLKVNDCIVRVNNLDCRDVDRREVLETFRSSVLAASSLNVVVKRRKFGRRCQVILHNGSQSHGLTLDLGVYVARIAPSSSAAKEGSIAVGDRILAINDVSVEHVDHLGLAVKLLDSGREPVVLNLAKPTSPVSTFGSSSYSSSSGHNMQLEQAHGGSTDRSNQASALSGLISPKSLSSTASPIKDTIRGSQEFMRKLMKGSLQTSSSSSGLSPFPSHQQHQQQQVTTTSGLMDAVKEKLRRRSKEPVNVESHESLSSVLGPGPPKHPPPPPPTDSQTVVVVAAGNNELQGHQEDEEQNSALAELDSVIDYHQKNTSGSSTSSKHKELKKSGSGKKKRSSKEGSGSSSTGKSTCGTWPRTRGGPVIEHGTGTILHPQKTKKERRPLAELLHNLPKYPLNKESAKPLRADNPLQTRSTRETRRQQPRPLTTYEYYSQGESSGTDTGSRNKDKYRTVDHAFLSELRAETAGKALLPATSPQQAQPQPQPTTDTSIDDSVKSGHVEKEFLERYLKKSSTSSRHRDLPQTPQQQQQAQQQQAAASTSLVSPPPGSAARVSYGSPYLVPLSTSSPTRFSGALTSRELQQQQHLASPLLPDFRPPQAPDAESSLLMLTRHQPTAAPYGHSPYQPMLQTQQPHHAGASVSPSAALLDSYASSSAGSISSYPHVPSSVPQALIPSSYGHASSAIGGSYHNPSAAAHLLPGAKYGRGGNYSGASYSSSGLPLPLSLPGAQQLPVQYQGQHGIAQPSPSSLYSHIPSSGSSHERELSPPPLYQPSSSSIVGAQGVLENQYASVSRRDYQGIYQSARTRIPSNTSLGSSMSQSSHTSLSQGQSGGGGGGGLPPQSYSRPQSLEPSSAALSYARHLSPYSFEHGSLSQYSANGGRSSSAGPPPLIHGSTSPWSASASPSPSFSVHYHLPDGTTVPERSLSRKPRPGDIRGIKIERTTEALGITIDEGSNEGVFVASVSKDSLASHVGLQVGDQILEVYGVNVRSCGKETAARVLSSRRNTFDMKVQFNPSSFSFRRRRDHDDDDDEPEEEEEEGLDSDLDDDHVRLQAQQQQQDAGARSESPTPRNSPKSLRSQGSLLYRDSAHSTLTGHRGSGFEPPRAPASPPYEPRLVYPTMKKSGDLGVRLVGGNAVGIFVHSVERDSAAYAVSIRCADQILEYNDVDLRKATAEQAAYELAKPAEKVSILVQYNPDKYNLIKDRPGDSYYIRAMFDRLQPSATNSTSPEHPPQLLFARDDILYVDNTMYNGVPGLWSAWLVDAEGQRTQWGVVPSKYKVEEELLMKRALGGSGSDLGGSSGSGLDSAPGSGTGSASSRARSTWTATRRSFFKRKGKGRSREGPKELASFSDMASLSLSDSGALNELTGLTGPAALEQQINSYIRVERLDYLVTRPVLLVGPLADAVMDKLVSDFPHKYSRSEPRLAPANLGHGPAAEELERELRSTGGVIEVRRRGQSFECTTVEAIKEVCDRNQHCILSTHLESVDRLHAHQIYPIVLLLKFKSVKQIKEVKIPSTSSSSAAATPSSYYGHHGVGGGGLGASGSLGSSEFGDFGSRISQKDAKNIFEHTQKLEAEYRHLISDVVHAGANLMLMCAQINGKIDDEQNKTLWVPAGSIW